MTRLTSLDRRQFVLAAGAAATLPALATLTAPTPATAKAPMLGPAAPTFRRFKLGAFEVTTIFDGAIQLDGPHPIFGENVSQSEVAALVEERFLPATKLEIGFTPVVVNTGAALVMFDAGNGVGRRPNAGLLAARFAEAGIAPADVDVVAITHMHPDHIGGLMEDGKPLFPNARYVTAAAEYDFWSPAERASGPTERVGKLVQSNVVPLAEKFTFLKPGDDVVTGISSVDASGHTPGHMAFRLESEGKGMLLWGDACNHYVASLERPDWHVRFDMDKERAVASRKRILDMAATDKLLSAGYHMPFPAVGYVERQGASYRWAAATYQLNL
ncbi:MAG: MBL fold metallo-hydrolase [Rhizobiales bacterium]|nr:MBL fold metallo-hydrolase [Hyphomicrobiales bacterium]